MDYSSKEARESVGWSLLQGLGTLSKAQDATKVIEIGKHLKLGVLRCISLQLWRIIQEDFGARWIDTCLLSWATQYCRILRDPLEDDKFERCLLSKTPWLTCPHVPAGITLQSRILPIPSTLATSGSLVSWPCLSVACYPSI